MNILTNFVGHSDLAQALYLLFEKRLGGNIYEIGDVDMTKVLSISSPEINPNLYSSPETKNGIDYVKVKYRGYTRKVISIDKFIEMDFNFAVVTNGRSEVPFYNLIKKYKPNTVFIRQIGNLLETPKICKNVLLSTKTPMPNGVNWITYHPEHTKLFKYLPHKGPDSIKSFSNFLRVFKRDAETWDRAKILLPEFEFKMHGSKTDNRTISIKSLPSAMRQAKFIWHTKAHGNCGFVAREALSTGRPLIVKYQYAVTHKTLAQDYLKDSVNCIDIHPNRRSLEDGIKLIRRWNHPDEYKKKCEEVLSFYNKCINFDEEEYKIKKWLKILKPISKE